MSEIVLTELSSAPDTPATGKWKVYTKSDGLYIVDDTGTEHGPFGLAGAAEQIIETGGPTTLDIGAIADGEYLKRDGTDVVGATPSGSGDMTAAVYDPTSVADDAFDCDNHADGATNGVYTLAERSKLIMIEAEADVTDAGNVAAAGAAMAGGAFHDGFSDFVANEHIDWTADQGATNIDAGNIPDLSGTYAAAAKGVTNGDSHDHSGGDGAQIDHGGLAGLGDDDHTQYIKHSLATAANDFLVASGVGSFIKKTLAEVITILRTSLDSVYAAVANGVTNGDTHDHSGGDGAQIAYGNLSGTPSLGTMAAENADDYVTVNQAEGDRILVTDKTTGAVEISDNLLFDSDDAKVQVQRNAEAGYRALVVSDTDSPKFFGMRSRGAELAADEAVEGGDTLADFGAWAFDDTGWSAVGGLRLVANQTMDSDSHGTRWELWLVPDDSTTETLIATITADGVMNLVSGGAYKVNGVEAALISAAQTLTNKRITKRSVTVTVAATPSINTDDGDVFRIGVTGDLLDLDITSMTANLSGTPTHGQMACFEFLDDGTARGITWGASFRNTGPSTTTASKLLRVLCMYDLADSKWDILTTWEEE